jgi:glutaredoxin-like protein NrdH
MIRGLRRVGIMDVKHVAGMKKGKVMLYALSTCGWCKKTKALLNELGVEYDYTDVDLLKGDEQNEALKKIKKFNPECNFPTMIINDRKCIIGFKEDDIREALG